MTDLRLVINVRIDKNDLFLDVVPQDYARKGQRSTVQLRAETPEILSMWQQALKTTIAQYATSLDRGDSESEFESSMERGESEARDASFDRDRSWSRGRPSSSSSSNHPLGGSKGNLSSSRKKYLDLEDMRVAMDIKDEELIVLKRIISEMETSKAEQMFMLEASHEKEVSELKQKLEKVRKQAAVLSLTSPVRTTSDRDPNSSSGGGVNSGVRSIMKDGTDSAIKAAGAAAADALVAEMASSFENEEMEEGDKQEVDQQKVQELDAKLKAQEEEVGYP